MCAGVPQLSYLKAVSWMPASTLAAPTAYGYRHRTDIQKAVFDVPPPPPPPPPPQQQQQQHRSPTGTRRRSAGSRRASRPSPPLFRSATPERWESHRHLPRVTPQLSSCLSRLFTLVGFLFTSPAHSTVRDTLDVAASSRFARTTAVDA